jgi:hypothetical protein
MWFWTNNVIYHKTAIFRQRNLHNPHIHHDALEFPNGELVLLTYLMEWQQATVLQLPASAGIRVEQETGRANDVSPRLLVAVGMQ